MKVIIAGSRSITDLNIVIFAMDCLFIDNITEIVSGGASGVGTLGEEWAEEFGYKVTKFIPDWTIGKHAGLLRNKQMAEYADWLVAIWDGKSKGTKHMIDTMLNQKKNVFIYPV